MRRIVIYIIVLIWIQTSLLTFPFSIFASGVTPFEISPILPGNQNPEVTGYYDINVNPDEKVILSVNIKNNQLKPITINITPLNATTSQLGDIVYDVNSKKEQFVNLKVPLQQIGVSKNGIEIPANSSITTPIEFYLPNVTTGIVVGGIHVIADNATFNENVVNEGNASFKINNQIAYVIGLKMQFPTSVNPEFSFGKVRVDMQYGKPKVFLEMKNSAPAVIKDLSGTYTISDKKGKTVLEGSFSKMKMAPNTRFEYAIDWKEGKVKPGKYSVKLTGTADGEKLSAEREFVIKDTAPIKDYNKETKNTAHAATIQWWNYLIIVVGVGFIFFIVGRKSKKKKKYQRQKFDFLE